MKLSTKRDLAHGVGYFLIGAVWLVIALFAIGLAEFFIYGDGNPPAEAASVFSEGNSARSLQ